MLYDVSMLIHDTLSGKKKRLGSKKRLEMFVCGPTVYDHAHIGHARVYIVFDMIARWLRQQKINLFYLQNITDIDDKVSDLKTARRFEKEYLKDMKTLGITSVDKYARASAHLPEIKKQIKVLLDKGFAYETKSGIYFEVKKFSAYGKLSRQNLNQLRPGWRIEPDPEKKDPLDFALWKFNRDKIRTSGVPGDTRCPWYSSLWSSGRPGWHIEDTAITEKYFGPQYDLHGAAVDLKFPHHESEIAQQESASGKKPMVKIWMHAGFLLINGEKMSKSLKNFLTIRDFLNKVRTSGVPKDTRCPRSSNILRLLILSHHYRSPINYTDKLVKQYQNSLKNIEKFMRTISPFVILNGAKRNEGSLRDSSLTLRMTKKIEREFSQAMNDDFNTPKALAALFGFMATAPKNDRAKKFLSEKLGILGINTKPPRVPISVNKLLIKREKLRDSKSFKEADKIRKEIEKKGFLIEDL